MAGTRPFGVTIIGFVIIVTGVIGLITAIIGLFNQDVTPLWASLGMGAISLIYVVLARGLFSGSGGARMIVGLFTLLSLVMGVWTLIFLNGLRIQGLVQALVAIIVLMVLYGPRAKAFFR